MREKEILSILGGRMVCFFNCQYGENPSLIGMSRIDEITRSGKDFNLHYADGEEIILSFRRAKDYAITGLLFRHKYGKVCVEAVQRPSYIVRKINLTKCPDIITTLRENLKQMVKERKEIK